MGILEEEQVIELRNEKPSKVVGFIPSLLVRTGITLITVILGIVFFCVYFIPYPENVVGKVIVQDVQNLECHMDIIIPYKEVARIKECMPVKVELEGYEGRDFGYLEGTVSIIDKKVITLFGENYFKVQADVLLNSDRIELHKQMKGSAYILLSDRSLFSTILNTIVK